MANSRGAAGFKNLSNTGKQPLLPPKSPFPSIAPSYADYGSSSSMGTKGVPKPREVHRHHQRTSSESFLVEESPSWLDDLLNEPETPVRRGSHRRSSSDSFAYLDTSTNLMIDPVAQEEYKYKNVPSVPSWGSQDLDHFKEMHHDSFYPEGRSFGIQQQNRGWESSVNSVTYTSNLPSTAAEKQDRDESGPHDMKGSSERKDGSFAKPASETDAKKAKQQFAQRSRVRKLQYIAELERNVQALQAEGSGVSAELQFLDQQNLILNMENRALKQRLDSLTQEQLIKYMEHEMLEREIARLRVLFHQQQQQQPPPTHNRSRSIDLDSQFANLSLKHKDPNCSRDSVGGPLHI